MKTENTELMQLLDLFAQVVDACSQKTTWLNAMNHAAHGTLASAYGVLALGRVVAQQPPGKGELPDVAAVQRWTDTLLDPQIAHRTASAQEARLGAVTALVALAVAGYAAGDTSGIATALRETKLLAGRALRGTWIGIVRLVE